MGYARLYTVYDQNRKKHVQHKAKENQSLHRAGETLRVPDTGGSQISRQPAHEGG